MSVVRLAHALGPEGNARFRRDEVVEDEELDEGEGLGPVELGAEGELAEALRAEVAGEVHALPERLLDLERLAAGHLARDEDVPFPAALLEADAAGVVDERREVRVLEGRA